MLIVLGVIFVLTPFLLHANFFYQQNKLKKSWTQKKITIKKQKFKPKVSKSFNIKEILNVPLILKVPKINLNAAVVKGVSALDLAKGPGLVNTKESTSTNIAIAGHRTMYGAPFKQLNQLAKNDTIYLLTPFVKLKYNVKEIKKVKPNDTSVVDNYFDNRITLLTCDPIFSARFRLVVIGKLTKVE